MNNVCKVFTGNFWLVFILGYMVAQTIKHGIWRNHEFMSGQ